MELLLSWGIFIGIILVLWFAFHAIVGFLLSRKGFVGDVANIIVWLVRIIAIAIFAVFVFLMAGGNLFL